MAISSSDDDILPLFLTAILTLVPSDEPLSVNLPVSGIIPFPNTVPLHIPAFSHTELFSSSATGVYVAGT